jgi:membrane protease YdiL (CAAX protease family)
VADLARRAVHAEILVVLGLSLGASAIWSLLQLLERLTRNVPLGQQTTTMNPSVTPDRPWLDLAYQLTGIALALVPVLALAGAIGIPGLGLYAVAKAVGVNTQVSPANLSAAWWTVPVLVLAAVQAGLLEEVVVVGYLLTRLEQAGWSVRAAIAASALVRGAYHLYQGFGGFAGNVVMGVVFALVWRRTRRVGPLVVAHALIDIVAFVGYTLARDHLSWL